MRTLCKSRSPRQAVTRLEVVAVIVIIAILLFVVALPSRPWGRGDCSVRLVCASNIKGIGTYSKIYANENYGSWPVPGFDEDAVGQIDYRVPAGGGDGTAQSPNRRQQSTSGSNGATKLGVSRALWMMVRSGDITVYQFICPTAGDSDDPTNRLDDYYDFTESKNLSYGFQVPFTTPDKRAREGADNRMIFAADKGPYRNAAVSSPPPGLEAAPPRIPGYPSKPIPEWKSYNSPNHGGEGQNVLYADGHSEYQRVPTVGVDGDNIYTIALDNFNEPSRTSGESPWLRSSPPFSGTDSVIFP